MAINLDTPVYKQLQDVMNSGEGETSRLSKFFSPVVANAQSKIDASVGDQLRRLRSSQAARGILRSGVSDYPTVELYKAGTGALGDTIANLSSILGNTEGQRSLFKTQAQYKDYSDTQDYLRSMDLARQIAKSKQKSKLGQIFEGVSAFAPLLTAAFGPGGAGASALAKMFAGSGGGGGGADSSDVGGFF